MSSLSKSFFTTTFASIQLASPLIHFNKALSIKGVGPFLNKQKNKRKGELAIYSFGIDVNQYQNLIDPEIGYPAVYSTLGVLAFGFFGTFFVAPQFKDSFKEAEDWKSIYEYLSKLNIKSVKPTEALKEIENGSILIDVSTENKFKDRSAQGSFNYALYQLIQGWDLPSIIRRIAFTFFGIPGTERNPRWLEEIEKSISKDKKIIVMCDMGGNLTSKLGLEYGFQSRSLKAIYYLKKAGYRSVSHLEGGMQEWTRSGLPLN